MTHGNMINKAVGGGVGEWGGGGWGFASLNDRNDSEVTGMTIEC